MSLTRECADVTGIRYVMDSYRDEAEVAPQRLVTSALRE